MKAINECDTAVGYVQIRQCSSLTCEIVCVCVHMRERHRSVLMIPCLKCLCQLDPTCLVVHRNLLRLLGERGARHA